VGAGGDVDGILRNFGVVEVTEGYDWNHVVHCGTRLSQK
jgi:hypothetical protein